MRKIRQHNDFTVRWSLVKKDTQEPFILEGMEVSLVLKNLFASKELNDFTVQGNTIEWEFKGKEQTQLGVHTLTLTAVGNKMLTTDACDFVDIVDCDCKTGGDDPAGLETQAIALTSVVEFGAGGGDLSAYLTKIEAEATFQPKGDYATATELTELSAEVGKKVDADKVATINGQSLVGGGNLTIEGGKGEKGDKGDKGDQGNSGYTGAADELEVVNNLTQGGATAALSAEMGKNLAEIFYGKNDSTISITSSSTSYTNVFFEDGLIIPKGCYIKGITHTNGIAGYLIQPNGSYVEVKLISAIVQNLPYQLPSDCGGLKLNGTGTVTIVYSDSLEAKKGLLDEVEDLKPYIPSIHICDKLYAVKGDAMQIFYKSIVECLNIKDYYIRINGEGASYPRYHEIKPTEVGEKQMVVEVYDNNKLIASKEFTLVVSEQPSQPSSIKRVSFFGDSLTEPAIYPAELKRMLTTEDAANGVFPQGKNLQNIEFVGAMTKEGVNYYGVGGWGWSNYAQNTDSGYRFYTYNLADVEEGQYYQINGVTIKATSKRLTDMSFAARYVSGSSSNLPSSGTFQNTSITYTSFATDTANPLWDGSKPSFKYYFENIGVNGEVSTIAFLLGWNILYMDLNRYENDVRTLITTAHSEYPSARFCLVGIQLPSLNGGLAYNYPNDTFFSDKLKVISSAHAYNEWLQNIAKDYDWVDYVDVASQFDSENNMPQEEKNVNLRNERKEYQGINGVHPSNSGYYQIADVMYRYICANL